MCIFEDSECLTWPNGQLSSSCHPPPPTSLSSLASVDRGLFTDLGFGFAFCLATGSLEISNFQLREVENASFGEDLKHTSSCNEFAGYTQ